MKKILIIGIVFFFRYLGAQTEKTSFTLEEAKKYAAENHFSAKNSKYESMLAEQSVKVLRSIGLPQINLEGNFQNFINLPVSLVPADAFGFPDYLVQFLGGVAQATGVPLNAPAPNGNEFSELQFGTNFNVTGGVTVSQLLFDGSYFYGLQAARAYAEMNKELENKSVEDIQNNVEKAYYMVLISNENIKLLTNSKNTLEDVLKQLKAMKEEGFVEEQDVDQIQLTLANIETSLSNSKLQNELALNMLKFQMGYDIEQPISLVDDIAHLSEDVNALLLKSDFSAAGTSDYKIMDYREKLLTLNKKVEVSKAYPRLIGFFSHTENSYFNDFKIPDKWYPTTLWGLKLQVPLFNGGGYYPTIKKTTIELERIKDAKKYTEQGLLMQYNAAKTEFTAAASESKQSKASMDLAQKIKEKTKIKFTEGISSSMDLTQSENQYLSAQGAYIGSLLKLLNTKANLQKLTK